MSSINNLSNDELQKLREAALAKLTAGVNGNSSDLHVGTTIGDIVQGGNGGNAPSNPLTPDEIAKLKKNTYPTYNPNLHVGTTIGDVVQGGNANNNASPAASGYTQSPELQAAAAELAKLETNKPADYTSQYGGQIQGLLDQILNRKDFSYNFNADPLYQQYKDQYQQQGKQAMQDTMGQAAALTGGYGNTYASTAGQQAYQQDLSQINNVIPQLQDAAYQKYENEGTQLGNNLSTLEGMDQTDYGKYRDNIGDYENNLNYAYTKDNNLAQNDYAQYEDNRNFDYQKTQDQQTQDNTELQNDYAMYKAGLMSYDEYAAKYQAVTGGTLTQPKATSGGGGGGSKYKTEAQIQAAYESGKITYDQAVNYMSKLKTASPDSASSYTGIKNGKYYLGGKQVSSTVYFTNTQGY